jgi:hypothetical protein
MVGDEVRIGYSFWGFIGSGVTDTPDGGRSHRGALLAGLLSRGLELVFLQKNRDRTEAGTELSRCYRWDLGHPDIDALFLEWRWPIEGRNTTQCGSVGHTCDLHRQQDLLDHYTYRLGIPTIVWDKDQRLAADHPLRRLRHVTVCEAALHPNRGATSLLFPVRDAAIDTADPRRLAAQPRETTLVYIGNQYDRDAAFDKYFSLPAREHVHKVAGKWTRTGQWPYVNFMGRVPFSQVEELHSTALGTILLLPERYARSGQMTQRLPEAVLSGCLPLTPAAIRSASIFTPKSLHVKSGWEASQTLNALQKVRGTDSHAELIDECIGHLNIFRLSRQLDIIEDLLDKSRMVAN